MRLDIVFVSVCMVLIAGSAGAMTYVVGFGLAPAALLAVGLLTTLGLSSMVSARLKARPAAGGPLVDVRGEMSRQDSAFQDVTQRDLVRQVTQLERGFAALDRRLADTMERTRAATDPLAVELGELGSLVRELAETLTVHEQKIAEIEDAVIAHVDIPRTGIVIEPPSAPAPVEKPVAVAAVAAAPAEPPPAPTPPPAPISAPVPAPPPAAEVRTALADAMTATIRSAIEANRVDLYLQPIVTLPQRKIRYYEALSRLRSDTGDVVLATDFLTSADAHGLMSKIDNLVIFRCVQVIRRLLLKNREIGLFCNLSSSTLTDGTVFPQLLEFLDANRAIASSIVLEFPQSALRAAGPIEIESLAALADRGYRFSLDNVTDLRLEPRELATRGFRFVKVRADVLLRRVAAASDIDPADLSDLLGRFGVDLIAERIESEGAVVDLLDYDVKFGQGFVFSPPRPVRAEALQGILERGGELAAREAVGAIEEAAPAPSRMTAGRAVNEAGPAKRASAIGQIARRI